MNIVTAPPLTAGANVRECRFLAPDGTTAGRAVESVSGAGPILGISWEASRFFPGSAADDNLLAVVGESLSYHPPLTIANLIAGAAFAAWAVLTSDSQGRGVAVANLNGANAAQATPVWIGGIALQAAGAAGEKVACWVTPPNFMKTA